MSDDSLLFTISLAFDISSPLTYATSMLFMKARNQSYLVEELFHKSPHNYRLLKHWSIKMFSHGSYEIR